MVGNDWENSLNGPNLSKSLPPCTGFGTLSSETLLMESDDSMRRSSSFLSSQGVDPMISTSTISAKTMTHGLCITVSDQDRIKIFVHEFCVRGLVPWVERTMRNLNEQVLQ